MLETPTIYSALLKSSVTQQELEELMVINENTYHSLFYEPEERSRTKYNLVITLPSLYPTHFFLTNSPNVNNHFLVIQRYKQFHKRYIALDIASYLYNFYLYGYSYQNSFRIFLKSFHIIKQPDYIKPEIAECIYLPSGECIAIKKTFWLSIIQRTWKNIYKKRLTILNERSTPQELYYWRIHGKWSSSLPSLRGMLARLRKKEPAMSSGV
jgi:hypothetical protein